MVSCRTKGSQKADNCQVIPGSFVHSKQSTIWRAALQQLATWPPTLQLSCRPSNGCGASMTARKELAVGPGAVLISWPTIFSNWIRLIFTLEYLVAFFYSQLGFPRRKLVDEITGTKLPSWCHVRERCSCLQRDRQAQWFQVFFKFS